MNSKAQTILIVILCGAVITNLLVIYYQQRTIRGFCDIPELTGKLKVQNILLKEGFFHTYDFEDTQIDYSISMTDINDGTIILQDLLSDKNSLVVYMQVGSCRDCLYDNIELIKEINKEKNNIVLLISGVTQKEFKLFVNQYGLQKLSYRLPNNYLPEFQINPVVYFVVDKELKSRYFYAPNIVFPELTRDYFDIITGRFNLG